MRDDTEELKTIPMQKVLDALGCSTPLIEGQNIRCIFPDHDDSNPSLKYYHDTNSFCCFGCNRKGTNVDLIKEYLNLDEKGAFSFLRENIMGYSRIKPAYKNTPKSEVKREDKMNGNFNYVNDIKNIATQELSKEVKDYLKSRYINHDSGLVKPHLWEIKDHDGWHFNKGYKLIVPEVRDDKLISFKYRDITGKNDPKSRNPSKKKYGLSPSLIGLGTSKKEHPSLMVEGEIDFLIAKSSLTNNKINIICVPSVGYRITQEEKKQLSDDIYILLDNTMEGKENSERLARELWMINRKVSILSYPEEIKDFGELAECYQGDFNMVNNCFSKMYSQKVFYNPINNQNDTILNLIRKLEDRNSDIPNRFETGIETFDNMINGGIRKGLYGLSAKPGAGKTSFLLSIARKLAELGNKVIIYSTEMTSEELYIILLSWMSGIPKTKLLDYALSPRDICRIKDEYTNNRTIIDNIIIFDKVKTVSEMEEMTTKIMNIFKQKVIVFIDYLQQIRSEKPQNEYRLAIKEIAYQLKDFALEREIPIFFISSIRRDAYATVGNNLDPLAEWKESGDIEFSLYVGFTMKPLKKTDIGLEDQEKLTDWYLPFKLMLVKNRWGPHMKDGRYLERGYCLNMKNGRIEDIVIAGHDGLKSTPTNKKKNDGFKIFG